MAAVTKIQAIQCINNSNGIPCIKAGFLKIVADPRKLFQNLSILVGKEPRPQFSSKNLPLRKINTYNIQCSEIIFHTYIIYVKHLKYRFLYKDIKLSPFFGDKSQIPKIKSFNLESFV